MARKRNQKVSVDYGKVAEIAPGILHDIGNTLTGVQAQISLMQLEGISSDSLAVFSTGLQEISSLLHCYNYQLMERENPVQCIDTQQHIKTAIDVFKLYARGLGIRLTTELIPADITGNLWSFKRIVLNLLINSIEALNNKKCRYKQITITSLKENGFFIFEIYDTGVGISAEDMARILSPGFINKSGSSHGLGLKVVRQAVESFGGDIKVKSKPGCGTKFAVFFPLSV